MSVRRSFTLFPPALWVLDAEVFIQRKQTKTSRFLEHMHQVVSHLSIRIAALSLFKGRTHFFTQHCKPVRLKGAFATVGRTYEIMTDKGMYRRCPIFSFPKVSACWRVIKITTHSFNSFIFDF